MEIETFEQHSTVYSLILFLHFYSEYVAILYDENLVSSIILASCKDNMISLEVV